MDERTFDRERGFWTDESDRVIYGQLAGAHHGVDGIPAHWVAALAKQDQIQRLTGRLIIGGG